MNTLEQQDSTLIGSLKDIEELAQKESARLLVFGDSHGYFDVVSDILLHFGNDVDAAVFCGDGFCDLIACMDQASEDDKLYKALPSVIIPVKGNGDSSEYPITLHTDDEDRFIQFSLLNRLSCDVAGRGLFVTHGDHYRVDMGTETLLAAAHAVDADMAFFGHTHKTHWEETGGTLVLNPGSCSRSRSTLPPSFVIVSFPDMQDRFKIEYYGIEKALFKNYKFSPLAVHMS